PAPPPRAEPTPPAPPPRAEPTPPAPPPDPQARLRAAAASRAAVLVAEGESSLRQARFEEALGRAIAARDALAPIDRHPEVEPLRAAAEVLAATAQVALGDDAGAQESFARALAAEPSLRLDPMTTSPKVLRVLDAARASAKGGS
ncbi:MAG: hypothetical protein QNK04_07160, partial [Myxococcota bacterium]|nr:hypothetical protein [Myxococcota bacterium]